MSNIQTNYGRTINDYLSAVPNGDGLTEGITQAGNSMSKSEQILGEAFTANTDEDLAKVGAKLLGKSESEVKTMIKDGKLSAASIQNYATHKYESAQRSFSMLQKIKDRAHDMMMEIIRSIGR